MTIIKFSEDDYKKCIDFSQKVNTSLYAQRNQFDANKRIKDAKIGKLGELAVYYQLQSKYPDITYPDFKIYSIKEKSWAFDMTSSSFNLHVKTQDVSQAKRYGASWIFQFGGGKVKHYDKEIFDRTSPNQYVAFVLLDNENQQAELKAIVSLDSLHENKLFSLPVLEKLQQANKLAVYYKELESKVDNLFQL